ncbi:hypothetical protein LX15_006259 [Streptoalloteichus tenebrarius]|uniref:Uncharacterized protein n=1 Tax=Streptoalloteichus tenebrarius (strain ATCC 17920 / DSM 40477 / JCM 4838 / CBS 697.72 / NBRC 16177 / NCIMB 11028 / NRRL B-12390 / A12253. 1 / ISP 5477) TaxID=1933 RepID=A0ABT1I435_STRSD|nr:hypothetical protein [Streptoalloteichus tenebrarius]MCP2262519.1 hypothetical protein [Streptoalloteichus tenebrarius]BFE99116.1 hypothetical protein GCM10020241_07920 [Streptoalloteichus tenebrarius]
MAVHTAQAAEAAARSWWERLPADARLTPPDYGGRAALIVCSTALTEAVVALLDERGVRTGVDQVRLDPAVPSDEVMALAATHAGRDVVIPMLPGQPTLRLYPRPEPRTDIADDPVATIDLGPKAVKSDGWVPAAVVADALHTALASSVSAG